MKNDMGRACSTYGSRGVYRILVWRSEGKNHLECPALEGRIILKWTFKKWDWSMDRIDLAQCKDRWRALVNAVMNIGVP